jgi:hypothetical protein
MSLVAVVAVLASVAIPASASASTSLTVPANSGPTNFGPPMSGFAGTGFTDSGVTLAAGQQAVVTASGNWSCDFFDPMIVPFCTGGPDGAPISSTLQDPSGFFQPQLNAFSLIGSLDGGSTWKEIGSGPTTVTGPGDLIFADNDNNYGDNSGSVSVTITPTVFTIGAFEQPINDPANPMSVFKDGSTVPVKFQLTDQYGNLLDDADAAAIAANCQATITVTYLGSGTGSIDETFDSATANSGNCFRYDPTSHQFIYNLGTKPLSTGTYTITATVTGTFAATHSVSVGLR